MCLHRSNFNHLLGFGSNALCCCIAVSIGIVSSSRNPTRRSCGLQLFQSNSNAFFGIDSKLKSMIAIGYYNFICGEYGFSSSDGTCSFASAISFTCFESRGILYQMVKICLIDIFVWSRSITMIGVWLDWWLSPHFSVCGLIIRQLPALWFQLLLRLSMSCERIEKNFRRDPWMIRIPSVEHPKIFFQNNQLVQHLSYRVLSRTGDFSLLVMFDVKQGIEEQYIDIPVDEGTDTADFNPVTSENKAVHETESPKDPIDYGRLKTGKDHSTPNSACSHSSPQDSSLLSPTVLLLVV